MVSRVTPKMLDIDGLKVKQDKASGFYVAVSDELIGSIRLQALYLFLEKEDKSRRERFELYVDKLINKLIYN
jgi:hypothetical protein